MPNIQFIRHSAYLISTQKSEIYTKKGEKYHWISPYRKEYHAAVCIKDRFNNLILTISISKIIFKRFPIFLYHFNIFMPPLYQIANIGQ